MTTFCRGIVNNPGGFSPEMWQLFLQSSVTALGGKCRPVRIGDVEATHYRKGNARVATAAGGSQPRGVDVWGHCARGSQ